MLLRVLAEPSLAEGTWLNERCLGFLEKAVAELMRGGSLTIGGIALMLAQAAPSNGRGLPGS
ncbi:MULTISPECIES: hypothetical protein [unclassified Pseudomonas]|uniref:hypothetical protein n=1 Tax=unclassified Pseudomonas TaxID=196821 RepID=UPI0008716247|nr:MULTISPECIES: hypothetical protein [unclassified Pseudomonas]SCW78531.1 hypothetical protein SAMN03159481_02511 [Pseudomonas sp. NFACC56-3]SFK39245.1 hypothetical protein SAMN03159473_01794 [Pseudomonas sp. NFACC52]